MEKDKTKSYVNELFENKSSKEVEEILHKIKTVKNPDRNKEIENNIKKMLKTHGNAMLKEDLFNYIMRYRLNLDLRRNTEFDFWLVDKEACKIYHLEVRSVNLEGKASGLDKAIQLGRKILREGDNMFNTILKQTAQLSPEWVKVNILALPNIQNIKQLKEGVEKEEVKKRLESMNVLTAAEIQGNAFPFPRHYVHNPCKEAEFLGIFSTCVGSRFLAVDNQVFLISTLRRFLILFLRLLKSTLWKERKWRRILLAMMRESMTFQRLLSSSDKPKEST